MLSFPFSLLCDEGGMFHDDAAFDHPEIFNPDRFLASEFGTKPHVEETGHRHDMPFGSGRVSLIKNGWVLFNLIGFS